MDGEQVATSEEYFDQAQSIADVGAQTLNDAIDAQTADQIEWMSLGVFALVHEDKGDPTLFMQLSVAKDGTIGGMYWNESTDQQQSIKGAVDKESQRAVWTIGDKENTVVETGIYNLTQDETQVLIHFGADRTETWLLVRMDEPDESSDTGEGTQF